jgi:hypothetical protein
MSLACWAVLGIRSACGSNNDRVKPCCRDCLQPPIRAATLEGFPEIPEGCTFSSFHVLVAGIKSVQFQTFRDVLHANH